MVTIYAQSLPRKEIPEGLKEKLEAGQEAEKTSAAGEGEVAPKPKRFSIVAGEIVGDMTQRPTILSEKGRDTFTA